MGGPNPIWKCPECGAKQRYHETKLNFVTFPPDKLTSGCLWCKYPFAEFTTPIPIIEHLVEGRQFRLSMAQYEPYYRELFMEKMQTKGEYGRGHDKVARVLDEVGMSAVDKFGGLRNIHRMFLEALARCTEDAERKAKYQAEIDRREESKKRKKKPQMDDDAPKRKWNPKKPKAGERIHEKQRGYHKDYYHK
jgi:hypothetical protein